MQDLQCTGCGECCRKGGPLLHVDDISLLKQGKLLLTQLVTLRKGELTYDPVLEKLLPLEQEVIKIAGNNSQMHPWHCILHSQQGCSLHPLRPVQCKALFCSDAEQLKNIYTKGRLSREDIFNIDKIDYKAFTLQESSSIEHWLELALAHEEECTLNPLIELAETLFLRNEFDMEIMENAEIVELAQEKILQIVRYDFAFRDLCTQKAGIAEAFLPCLLGRPVHVFLRSLGIKIYADSYGELSLHATNKGVYFSVLQSIKNIS